MMAERKKILFLGQKEIGERCFGILYELWKQDKIDLVVSSNVSRDVWWKSNRIYEICSKEGIPFFTNEVRDDSLMNDYIQKYRLNRILSVQHNWILKAETLEMVRCHAWNLHLAKLPEYQGYCSFNHAIINREETYGVTLHWMTQKVDLGDIAYEEEFGVTACDTAFSLYRKSVDAGEKCFKRLMEAIQEDREIPRIGMTGTPRFYSRQSIEAYKQVGDLSDISYLSRIARACYFPPFESAYFLTDQGKVYLVPAPAEKGSI